MGISEMQRKFSAYGSGELPEFELRTFIRSALSKEPQLSMDFVELTEAYRRANLIDASLQSTINADIAEVMGPNFGFATMIRPVGSVMRAPTRADVRAANSTDVNAPPRSVTSPMEPMLPLAPMARNSAATSVRSAPVPGAATSPPAPAAPGGGWSARAQAARSTNNTTDPPANTGSTTGSNWDTDARLNEVATPLYPGSVIRDRFVLVDELGRGGMGVVYKAYDRSRGDVKDRYVAIKVLSDEFKRHPLAMRALQREARKAQRLAHPNVVAVHDFDRDGGNVYMVMELLTGRPLDQVLRDDGQGGIPLGPAMQIIKCLGAALSHAHEHDIVHCDFKPGNAFLGRDGKVKVLDFGIARAAPSLLEKGDATLFDAGQLGAISPAYASLEMLQRETPDVRDDVYAFSCVAYELLTGVHPYQRIDAVKAFQSGLQPRPIRKVACAQTGPRAPARRPLSQYRLPGQRAAGSAQQGKDLDGSRRGRRSCPVHCSGRCLEMARSAAGSGPSATPVPGAADKPGVDSRWGPSHGVGARRVNAAAHSSSAAVPNGNVGAAHSSSATVHNGKVGAHSDRARRGLPSGIRARDNYTGTTADPRKHCGVSRARARQGLEDGAAPGGCGSPGECW